MSEKNMILENTNWPPTMEQFKNIALSALDKSKEKNFKVLVYWKNDPNLMIFNPIHYANTKYVSKGFKTKDGRLVEVHIGEID